MANEIDELERRLTWERGGELADFSNQATSAVLSKLNDVLAWLRRAGEDRPLITLLLAFEAGYVIARLGRRRAKG